MERKTEVQRISERHNWFYEKINKTEKVSQSKEKTHVSKIRNANKTIWLIQGDFTLKSYMPWEAGGEEDKRELNSQSDIIIFKEKYI